MTPGYRWGVRRLWLVLGTVLSVLPVAVGVPERRVEAAPNDIIAVVVEGFGYGHGRGMSQWGAFGWAVDQGRSWHWILDHYYGGTVMGDAGGRIRVRLTGLDGAGTVGVVSHGSGVRWGGHTRAAMYSREVSANRFEVYGATTRACPGGNALTVPNGPVAQGSANSTAVRQIQTFLNAFRVAGDATLGVDGDFGPLTRARLVDWQGDQGIPADGVWNGDDAARARTLIGAGGSATWTLLGTVAGPITFTAAEGEASGSGPGSVLGACSGGSVTHYRGRIEVHDTSAGNRVVNDVKVEDYLRGVVPREIAASWASSGGGRGANAVRAQAVAARSFGLSQARYSYAQTCDTQSCQVYAGAATRPTATASPVSVEHPATDAAIAATAGKVRKWPNGSIVSTEFSASNGPRTAGGAFPPVDDAPGDGTSRNPNHRWTRVLDADTLASRYGLGTLTGASMTEAASTTFRQFDGVWFNDIVLQGTNGTFRQQAWDFRGSQGLPSPGFTVRVVRENTTNRSLGFIGDSVGVSVAGTADAELQRVIDGTFAPVVADSIVGRCTVVASCPGTSGVDAARALPRDLDVVVVELGYNDWPAGVAGYIDQMMTALAARGARQVAWVNVAEVRTNADGSSYYAATNAALAAARARWPGLTVLDWNAASNHGERARWLSDGIHLTATGQAEFALWLRERLIRLAPSHRLVPPKRLEIPVVGRALTRPDGTTTRIPASAGAVALNLTGVGAALPGYATAWPCHSSRPLASNLNYYDRHPIANNVIAPIGPNGTVCVYAQRSIDVVVDIAGWFPGDGSSSFNGVRPRRLVDTRDGTGGRTARLSPTRPLQVTIGGARVQRVDGASVIVPRTAEAAFLNITGVEPVRDGFITAWPCDQRRPLASSLNARVRRAVPNGVIAPLDGAGTVCLYSNQVMDVVVDIAGWFDDADGSAGSFVGTVPLRLLDSRDGTGGRTGRIGPGSPVRIAVRGRALQRDGASVRLPADATAAVLNVTSVDGTHDGYATVWPCGTRPLASNLNFTARTIVANGVVAPIGSDGTICIHTHRPVHVVVDIAGWFEGGGTPAFVGATPLRVVDTRSNLGPRPS